MVHLCVTRVCERLVGYQSASGTLRECRFINVKRWHGHSTWRASGADLKHPSPNTLCDSIQGRSATLLAGIVSVQQKRSERRNRSQTWFRRWLAMFSSPFVVCNRRIRLVLGRRRHQHAATSESMNFARKKSFRYLHLPHWHLERSKRRERYGKGARPRHIDSGQRLVSRLESGDRWDVLRSPARQPLARMHPVIASWMHLSTAAPRCGLAVQLLAYFATMSMFVVLPCDASKIPHVTTRLDGINRSLLADQEDGKTPSRSVRGIHETLQRTRSCVGCDLSALDLSASVLSGADLHGSILERTNLFHARLSGANLHAARLEESNLDEAALDGADLSAVNLKQATLRRTLLLGAHFDHNMLIEGADFSEAILDRADQRLLCELANGVNSQTGVSTFESLSCPSVKPSQVP